MFKKILSLSFLLLSFGVLFGQQFDNADYKQTWLIKDGKFTLIDVKTQKTVVPPIYDEAHFLEADLSLVRQGTSFGLIDSEGENLLPLQYQGIWNYNNKLILVKRENKYSFVEKKLLNGSLMGFADLGNYDDPDDIEYDDVIFTHTDDYGIVRLGDRFGYIDDEGNEVIPLIYEGATIFEEGYASVQFDGKWGIIDKDGNVTVRFEYRKLGSIMNGVTVAQKGKKWGMINSRGTDIIPFEYKYLTHFNDNEMALAKKGKDWGVINVNGKTVIPFDYEYDEQYVSLMDLTDGYLWIKRDNKWGTIDFSGKVIIPFEYDQIHSFDGDEARVWKNGELTLINDQGECLENCNVVFFDFNN